MKFRKKLSAITIVAVLSLSFTSASFAQDQDVEKRNDVNAKLNSGGFDLVSSSIKTFDDITLKEGDEKYSTGFEDNIVVTDLRGLDEDWQLSVSSTSLKSLDNPNDEFENVLSISPFESVERVGDTHYKTTPSNILESENILDDGDVPMVRSRDGDGLGKFVLTMPEEAIHLAVSPEMKQGNYETTVTWNLMSVPGVEQ